MNKIYLLAATIFAASSVQAGSIPLTNGDFEATTANFYQGFDPAPDDTTPGWSNYGTNADGGVELNGWWGVYNPPGRSAFVVNGTGAYNTSAHTIQAGEVFTVGFVGKSWGPSSQIKVTLFYNTPGTPDTPLNVIGTFTQNVTGTYVQYYSGAIEATAESVGGTLGVIIEKPAGTDVIAWDDVTLSVSLATPTVTFTLQPPESVSKFVGESLTLSAVAISNDPITFQWQKSTDGGTTWADVEGETGTSYTFSPSYADTGAQFRLNGTNTSGTVASTVSTLTVSYPAPTVTKGLLSHTVVPGTGDVTFTAEATGLGSLTFTWSKDGVVIPDATSGSLTVRAATVADTATYTLVIADDAATASGLSSTTVTLTAQLTVVDPASTTVAYFRFEEGIDAEGIATADDSVGANILTGVGSPNYTAYSSLVPAATVPKTGESNTLSATFPAGGAHGLVAPIDGTLATTTFTDFTIECYVQFDDLDFWQTFVGRDDSGDPGQGNGGASLFYLQKMGDSGGNTNRIRAFFNTANGNDLEVVGSFVPLTGQWYHVAVVGDSIAGTCTLYIDGTSVGSATGFPGLRVPISDTNNPTPWTIGRGQYGGGATDYMHGYVDEVRFSRVALPVSKFLISPPGSGLTALQTWRQMHFNMTEPTGDAANDADPDADGVTNLLEYALAGDPMVAENDLLPVATVVGGKLTLSFDRIDDPTLLYEVLATDDLTTWAAPAIWSSTGEANTAGLVTVPDTELLSAHARRFLRLRVTAP